MTFSFGRQHLRAVERLADEILRTRLERRQLVVRVRRHDEHREISLGLEVLESDQDCRYWRVEESSSAAVSVSMNSGTFTGFVRYRKNPALMPRSTSRGIAFALSAITGM